MPPTGLTLNFLSLFLPSFFLFPSLPSFHRYTGDMELNVQEKVVYRQRPWAVKEAGEHDRQGEK